MSEQTENNNRNNIPTIASEDCHRINTIDLEKAPLPKNFVPGNNDVIVGRGKKCYNHVGNQELRQIVKSKIHEYSSTNCKHDKSYILSSIVAQVRSKGGFVKKHPKTGQWFDVGDLLAREKISQAFRDALCDNYKSSTVFKRKKRQEKRAAKAAYYHTTTTDFMGFHHHFGDETMIRGEQLDWRQHLSLSSSMTMLDLESASDEPLDITERLSSSLPNLKFDYSDDPLEPVPFSQAFSGEEYHFGGFNNGPSHRHVGHNQDCYRFNPIHFSDDEDNNNDCILPFEKEEEMKPDVTTKNGRQFGSLPHSNIHIARTA